MDEWMRAQWELLCEVRRLAGEGLLDRETLELHERGWREVREAPTIERRGSAVEAIGGPPAGNSP